MNLAILITMNILTAATILWFLEWRYMTENEYGTQAFFLSLPAMMISSLMKGTIENFNFFELFGANVVEYVVVFAIFYAFGKLNQWDGKA